MHICVNLSLSLSLYIYIYIYTHKSDQETNIRMRQTNTQNRVEDLLGPPTDLRFVQTLDRSFRNSSSGMKRDSRQPAGFWRTEQSRQTGSRSVIQISNRPSSASARQPGNRQLRRITKHVPRSLVFNSLPSNVKRFHWRHVLFSIWVVKCLNTWFCEWYTISQGRKAAEEPGSWAAGRAGSWAGGHRKGTTVVNTTTLMGSLQITCFFDRGTFWVLLLNVSPQTCQGMFFPIRQNSVLSPLAFAPFVRDQGQPGSQA